MECGGLIHRRGGSPPPVLPPHDRLLPRSSPVDLVRWQTRSGGSPLLFPSQPYEWRWSSSAVPDFEQFVRLPAGGWGRYQILLKSGPRPD